MSFASLNSGKNLGCCIIHVDDPQNAEEKAKELGFIPQESNHLVTHVLNHDSWNQESPFYFKTKFF
jgi:hypothetical protein